MVTSTHSTPPLLHDNILSHRPHGEQMPWNEKAKYFTSTELKIMKKNKNQINHSKQRNILVLRRASPLRVKYYPSAHGLEQQVLSHYDWDQIKQLVMNKKKNNKQFECKSHFYNHLRKIC